MFLRESDLRELVENVSLISKNYASRSDFYEEIKIQLSYINNIEKSISNIKATQKNHSTAISEIKKYIKGLDKYITELNKERKDIESIFKKQKITLDDIQSNDSKLSIRVKEL